MLGRKGNGRDCTAHVWSRVAVLLCSLLVVAGSLAAGAIVAPAGAIAAPASAQPLAVSAASAAIQADSSSPSTGSKSANQSFPTDYDSWEAVSSAVAQQLNQAVTSYQSGDMSSASSAVSSAFNVAYISSNMISGVSSELGADRQQQQSAAFQSIQQLTYSSGHENDLQTQVSALEQDLNAAAQTLDGNAAIGSPREYAKARKKQTTTERKRLQSEKKTKFTGKGERTWSQVAEEMGGILDDAVKATKNGDGRAGSDKVNEAYYQYYEKLGFEKNVMNAISGSRVSLVESRFKECRKAMVGGDSIQSVTKEVNGLKSMLVEDAQKLDGGAEDQVNGFTKFITSSVGQAFIILIREGLEALLVVAAIVAYLVKSGNKQLVRWIYVGVVAGLAGSGIMAALFGVLFRGNGPQQEIMEGVVALIAMVMLLYTSNWMLSKSSVDKWNAYIKTKTERTVRSVNASEKLTAGGMFSLAMLSFLAVFREGAETVMFYESIYSMTQDSQGMWIGGIAAAVVLVIVFVIFRLTSVRIPIRPFFIITSVLMALLVVVFAGGGVHALIEGNLIAGTYLDGVPTSDWLGFYPYAETLVAQGVALVVVVALYVVFGIKEHRAHKISGKQTPQPHR